MPSYPVLCLVFKLFTVFRTFSGVTISKLKDLAILSVRYVWIVLLLSDFIFDEKLGPILEKKILKPFAIVSLSFTLALSIKK